MPKIFSPRHTEGPRVKGTINLAILEPQVKRRKLAAKHAGKLVRLPQSQGQEVI